MRNKPSVKTTPARMKLPKQRLPEKKAVLSQGSRTMPRVI